MSKPLPIILVVLLMLSLSLSVLAEDGDRDYEVLQVRDVTPTMLKPVTTNVTVESATEYFGMGVKPAIICVFRVCNVAFKTLWPGESPLRSDILVITTNPTRAVRDTFEFITRCVSRHKYILKKIPGTSSIKLTPENWVFTIVNEPTGEAVEIKVRKEVFPENLFELRASVKSKIKAGETPSEEEMKAFKKATAEFTKRLKTWSDEELFEVRTFSYTPEPLDLESMISYYLPEALSEWRRLKGVEEEYNTLKTDYEQLQTSYQQLLSEVEDLRTQLSQAQTVQWILGTLTAIFVIATIYLGLARKRS